MRRIAQGLALTLVALALTLTVVEVVVRQFVPAAPRYLEPQVLVTDSPTLEWRLRPSQHAFTVDAPVVTTAEGFRSDDVPAARRPGVMRILSIGDSIAFGYATPFAATYTQRLRALLQERHPGRTFEVVNLGVPGYNTRQELIALREFGLHYQPDVVVLGFNWNDIVGNDKPLPWEPGFVPEKPAVGADGHVKWAKRHVLPAVVRDTLRRWRTLYLAQERLKRLVAMLRPPQHSFDTSYRALLTGDERTLRPYWRDTERRLAEIAELGRANNFRTIVVVFPDDAQMPPRLTPMAFQAEVVAIAQKHGMLTVDLLEEFRRLARTGHHPFYYGDQVHPDAVGHEATAQALTRLVSERVLAAR